MNPKSPEESQQIFDESTNKAWEQLKPTHEKREYTFSSVEKRRLAQQDLIEKFAADALEDIINLEVLPRIGVTPSNEVFTLYDIGLSRLVIFTPKRMADNSKDTLDPDPKKPS